MLNWISVNIIDIIRAAALIVFATCIFPLCFISAGIWEFEKKFKKKWKAKCIFVALAIATIGSVMTILITNLYEQNHKYNQAAECLQR